MKRNDPKSLARDTVLVHGGRHPEDYAGAVNTPVVRASTILSPTLAAWDDKSRDMTASVPGTYYGRFGTPTHRDLEDALTSLEGAHRTALFPSGYAACIAAILTATKAGGHVLVPDSVYFPVRKVASGLLARMNVGCTFYDPAIGSGIEALLRPETDCVYLEAPGSLTFEMQDVRAITTVCRARGILTALDNTWATPLYFRPIEHGVDMSVQAATKYVVGHSDAMLGYVSCATREVYEALARTSMDLGYSVSADDAFLAARGLRTMSVRLERQGRTGQRLAQVFADAPEVARVLHPARPDFPGHDLWKRDFSGTSGLFGVVFHPMPRERFAVFVDTLEHFGIGASWGGYESLVMPMYPKAIRTAVPWPYDGPSLRVHAGLEDEADLVADLERAFAAMRRT